MRACLLLPLALVTAVRADARATIGWYGHWGAFRDAPGRCFARVAPSIGRGGLAISAAPDAGVRVQVHIDLPRPARDPILTIGRRRFVLASSGLDAWPINPRADLAVLAELRAGGTAEVRGVDQAGTRFRTIFPLTGAPSAIDAALIGCLPR